MQIRELYAPDLENGFLETLNALSPVKLTSEQARAVFRHRLPYSKTYVAVDNDKVIATASLVFEKKYSHGGKMVARIEDVAVRSDMQRSGLGKQMIEYVVKEAAGFGCRKITLSCFDHVVSFYEKCGFRKTDNGMRLDLE